MKRFELSSEELSLLGALVGLPLRRVYRPVWEGVAEFGDRLIAFFPEECSLVHGDNRRADRIRVSLETAREEWKTLDVAAEELGAMSHVEVIQTLVGFSPWHDAPSTEILGVRIPAGRGASATYLHPDDPAAEDASAQARLAGGTGFFAVDLGVRLGTRKTQNVTFYTDGVGYFVQLALDQHLERLSRSVLRYRSVAGPS